MNERLGLRVDIRCRLVKDENARILEESSSNRDSLPLTYGESDPAFANLSIVSLLEGDDEFVGVRRLSSPADLLIGCLKFLVLDVLPNRP